jgi:hypothetical protein
LIRKQLHIQEPEQLPISDYYKAVAQAHWLEERHWKHEAELHSAIQKNYFQILVKVLNAR